MTSKDHQKQIDKLDSLNTGDSSIAAPVSTTRLEKIADEQFIVDEKDIKLLEKAMLIGYWEAYCLLKQHKGNVKEILHQFVNELVV